MGLIGKIVTTVVAAGGAFVAGKIIKDSKQKKREHEKEILEVKHKNDMEKMAFESELGGKSNTNSITHCSYCGVEQPKGAKFCFSCGKDTPSPS